MSDQKETTILTRKQLPSLKRNKLYLAFPGMGKTPLTFKDGKFKDVDFGTFRTAMGVEKEDENELLPLFVRYLRALDKDWQGSIILTNEPKLMQYMYVDHVYLPERYSFSARKMNTSAKQIQEWVQGWALLASKAQVPVTYVSVGLDNYLLGRLPHGYHRPRAEELKKLEG